MRDIEESVRVLSAAEFEIALGLRTAENPIRSALDMRVIVFLVNDRDQPGSIYHRIALLQGGFDHPLVEPGAADDERRYVSVKPLRENEEIYAGMVLGDCACGDFLVQPRTPIRV